MWPLQWHLHWEYSAKWRSLWNRFEKGVAFCHLLRRCLASIVVLESMDEHTTRAEAFLTFHCGCRCEGHSIAFVSYKPIRCPPSTKPLTAAPSHHRGDVFRRLSEDRDFTCLQRCRPNVSRASLQQTKVVTQKHGRVQSVTKHLWTGEICFPINVTYDLNQEIHHER